MKRSITSGEAALRHKPPDVFKIPEYLERRRRSFLKDRSHYVTKRGAQLGAAICVAEYRPRLPAYTTSEDAYRFIYKPLNFYIYLDYTNQAEKPRNLSFFVYQNPNPKDDDKDIRGRWFSERTFKLHFRVVTKPKWPRRSMKPSGEPDDMKGVNPYSEGGTVWD